MSTIASPRDPSINGRRMPIITPTSSSRPSLENTRSTDASPNRSSTTAAPRRNRAALREYYNLKRLTDDPLTTTNDVASEASSIHDFSEVQESEMDRPDFDASSYIKNVLENQSLGELLRTYNGILTDIRALDAEKKALVYDNYSKLITATETIRKMRVSMDPLNPMARTLDPAIKDIYDRAEEIKEELRSSLKGNEVAVGGERKRRAKEVVRRVLDTPESVRGLVAEGREEEARASWEGTRRLLERWRERGVGGKDVQACIDDGEGALRGEPPNQKTWVNVKESKS